MKFKKYLLEGFSNHKEFSSDQEILRAAIIAEFDTVNFYQQLASKTSNWKVRKVLLHVAQEEKVHVGEFEELLEMIDPEHEPAEKEGEEELKDMRIK